MPPLQYEIKVSQNVMIAIVFLKKIFFFFAKMSAVIMAVRIQSPCHRSWDVGSVPL